MSRRYPTLIPRYWAMVGLLILAGTVVGCGQRPGVVSGTVTFKDRPLPAGTVLFHGSDGRVEHASIKDGSYTMENAPLGNVRITVRAHPAMPAGLPTRGKPPAASPGSTSVADVKPDGQSHSIPPRYLDPAKSGLTCTVSSGKQTHNIQLGP